MICWPLSWHKRFNCRQACEGVAGCWVLMTLKMLLDRRNYVGSTSACVAWLHPPSVCGSLSAPCTVLPKIEFWNTHASYTNKLDDMIFLQRCVCVWRIVWKVLVCVCLEVHWLSACVCVSVFVCFMFYVCVHLFVCLYTCLSACVRVDAIYMCVLVVCVHKSQCRWPPSFTKEGLQSVADIDRWPRIS